MKAFPVLTELPVAYYREIGRVAFAHAQLEHTLALTLFEVIGVPPNKGRVAVSTPRPKDIYERIEELLSLDGIQLGDDYKTFPSDLELCTTYRDQLLHGVWVSHQNTIYLRVTSGSWQPTPGMKGKIKRRIKPQGVPYDLQKIRSVRETIQSAVFAAAAFRKDINDALAAIREKT